MITGSNNIRFAPNTVLSAVLILVVFATQACGVASPDQDPVPPTGEAQHQDVSVIPKPENLTTHGATTTASTDTTAAEDVVEPTAVESVVLYLEETIPPCTPIAGGEVDPCISGNPPVMGSEGASISLRDVLPTFEEVFLWTPEVVPHLAVRVTVMPGTSRCGVYRIDLPNYSSEEYWGGGLDRRVHYHCFVEVRVNEYLVGEGPPTLTVSIYRESLLSDGISTFGADERLDEYFDGPSRTAATYEGRELVLLLGIPFTLDVETWVARNPTLDIWFVQRDGDELRAVSEDIGWARTAGHRNRLNMPLTQLVREVKQAAENRIAVTGGRIGRGTSLPLLVTDANKLHDFYGAVGAVYEGEGATVLPPPPPGGIEDPSPEPGRVGEDETEGDGPVGPGEETTTTTDETTTTSSATSTTTSATTTPTSTAVTTTPTTTTATTTVSSSTTVPTATTSTSTVSSTTVPTTTTSTTAEAAAPGPVRRFSLVAGDGTITASWTQPRSDGGSAIAGYELAYRVKGRAGRAEVVTLTAGGSDRSTVISALVNGTTYQVRIRAVNSVDNGGWSRWKQATPQAVPSTTVTSVVEGGGSQP